MSGDESSRLVSASIENDVIVFVATQTLYPAERLKLHTTLFGDLGVDGDDGDELLFAFMKRFGVNMQAYRGDRHFGPEGFAPWTPLLWLLHMWRALGPSERTPEARARLVPITIRDLIVSAETGQWSIAYDEKPQRLPPS